MDSSLVLRLFPLPSAEIPLRGLYLAEQLPPAPDSEPFVYGNYISSLDGRIALDGPSSDTGVPDATSNPRDWRLFQELAVQADVLIVSGSYLRRRASGETQEILSIADSPETADLRRWRPSNGLSPRPDIAVVSRSLDFPLPPILIGEGRRVWVFTTEGASRERKALLERAGATVVHLAGTSVDGGALIEELSARGYVRIYNAAGPAVHHLLLAAGCLHRLYLTFASRITAGEEFSSLVSGSELSPPARFRLRSLYLDALALDGDGQLFASYERVVAAAGTSGPKDGARNSD